MTTDLSPAEIAPVTPARPAPRARATARTEAALGVAGEDRHRLIAEAAYFRAEQRGFAPSRELDDWLAAEIEVDALLADDRGHT